MQHRDPASFLFLSTHDNNTRRNISSCCCRDWTLFTRQRPSRTIIGDFPTMVSTKEEEIVDDENDSKQQQQRSYIGKGAFCLKRKSDNSPHHITCLIP